MKTRIIVFVGGLFVLGLVAWIFIALLSSGNNGSIQNLTALAQEQAEIARISKLPSQNAGTETTQDLASTIRLSLASDEHTFITYLGRLNAAPSSDTLARGMNQQTDATLQAAQDNGTYDQTYISIAEQKLATYSADVKRAFNATSNPAERQLLNDSYANAQLLLALSQKTT